MTTYNNYEWYNLIGKELIEQYILDEDKVFTSDNGNKKGVYCASVVAINDNNRIMMYIGEVGRYNRGFKNRFIEHVHNWLNNPLKYIGIKREELGSQYKIALNILSYDDILANRYNSEQEFILKLEPYLQTDKYPKFSLKNYKGNDLCIRYEFRRFAFLEQVNNLK